MEQMESELAPVAGGLWAELLADPDTPEELRELYSRAATPQRQADLLIQLVLAGFAAIPLLSQLGLIQYRDLINKWNAKFPTQALDPSVAAAAVQRGFADAQFGVEEARKGGIEGTRFGILQELARSTPGLEGMLALWRRGAIDTGRLREAVQEAGVGLKWMPEVQAMGIIPPSPIEPLEALLEGQLDRAEALSWYKRFGGLPEYFDISFNTRGQAPTPVQALDLWNRGIIPEGGTGPRATSYEQAFLEGPWRNKWMEAFKALRVYLPPPRTIVTLLRNDAISPAEATDLLRKQGLTPDLARAYVQSASHEKTGPERDLAKSEVVSLYEGRFIDRGDAEGMLESLGYDPHEADLLLELADSRRDRRYQEALISTVHARYVAWKIDADQAQTALDSLHVPPAQKADLLQVWAAERAIRAPELTLAQAQGAVRRGLWDDGRLRLWLRQRGYDPAEVDVLVAEVAPAPRR